ncbi:MAG: UDP-glucose 4-epimerase GalE [Thiotrichales bacterium 39-47-5]|nr:MAG: UDP-glucose 4-epimerase GalE [Thiotrichales bacterium 35-46-9]OZA75267.1 MAG: UDP-glucose 4-epimerase GalE [Thiotrichales bacterium 39-47-5]
MSILVTGGAGYIGSHTVIALQQAGYHVVIADNLCNAKAGVLSRIEQITGIEPEFVLADIRNADAMARIFSQHSIDAVIHFAGLKAVGESVAEPLKYYDNNVNGTLVLLTAMRDSGVKTLVFSSSATVYGDPASVPVSEDFPLSATNPYGRSKLMIEDMLRDLGKSEAGWKVHLLRYFNPVGAHESGLIGEDPNGIPNNLMPFVSQVAVGRREKLSVFGGDYDTVDGTGMRDYIHVLDLAEGHVASLKHLMQAKIQDQVTPVNLGTGCGYSVLQVVKAFEQASGKRVPYQIVERRAGDVACVYANAQRAQQLLGWQAERDLAQMCTDSWHWQSTNPNGLEE